MSRKCRDCEFFGVRVSDDTPHCLVNDRMSSDFDLPCVLEEETEVCSILTWYDSDKELPATDEKVLCVTATKKGVLNVIVGYYAKDRWCCGMNSNVIFWAPLTPVYRTLFREIRNAEEKR